MNRERAKALLPIIQAFAEGKTIQAKANTIGWYDIDEPGWEYSVNTETEYRIKPEPREFWIRKRPMEDMYVYSKEPNFTDPHTEVIHVREVLDD